MRSILLIAITIPILGSGVWCGFRGVQPAQDAPAAPASPGASIPRCRGPRDAPEPEHMTRPKYPKKFLKSGIGGNVELRAVVASDGKTRELTVVSGNPNLAAPARDAVRRWRFHPALVEGKPVETVYKVRVRFVLLLQEAIPDWEIESPKENTEAVGGLSLPSFETDTTEGPVYKMSEAGVIAPKAIYQPEPEFSEAARKAREPGTVVLAVVVGIDGKPRSVKVLCSSTPDNNANAVDAVKSWKFEPGTKDGKPVTVVVAVEVQFRLG